MNLKIKAKTIQTKLIAWFEKNRRQLPWRFTGHDIAKTNPYHVFFVEVMLQQTQIKTVIPYYHRWLKAFPTIKRLANAPLHRVLKLWQGLGYYSRARNLHRAARIIVSECGGKIPNDPAMLEKLPGIGRYTAGAIASIAFQKQVPLVDGNVARVFSRLFLIRKETGKPETQKMMYAMAEQLVPEKFPGIFNQALMELGSLVCTPDSPKCATCPFNKICKACRLGNPESLPVRTRLKVKKLTMKACVLNYKGRVLIEKRPLRGIWGGLWGFPSSVPGTGGQACAGARHWRKLPPLQHQLTHRALTIYPYLLTPNDTEFNQIKESQNLRWANARQLKYYSFPVPYLKILKALQDMSL